MSLFNGKFLEASYKYGVVFLELEASYCYTISGIGVSGFMYIRLGTYESSLLGVCNDTLLIRITQCSLNATYCIISACFRCSG